MNAPEPRTLGQYIALSAICISPNQPRKHFDKQAMEDLTGSVGKHGVIEPILVRTVPAIRKSDGALYELVAGERRYRAAKGAKLTEIPAIVRELTDEAVLEIQLIENIQREQLHEMEEAEGYRRLMDEFGYTVEMLMDKAHKTRATIYARLKLCDLIHNAREAFYDGKLSASTALLIARMPAALQNKATKEITEAYGGEPLSYRNAFEHIKRQYMLRLKDAPFKTGDADLVPEAGSCSACPKRTGNQTDLFGDVKDADICTDPPCFGNKKTVTFLRRKELAEQQGQKVISGKAAEKILPYEHGSVQAGYVKLDDHCPQDPKNRTYRQLLGKEAAQPVLLEVGKQQKLMEILPEKQVKEVLKDKGYEFNLRSTKSASEQEREKKAKLENAYRQRLLSAIRSVHRPFDLDDLTLIAETWFRQLWHESRKRLAKLWLPDEKSSDLAEALQKRIQTMSGSEMAMLLIDMSLIGEAHAGGYNDSKPEHMLVVAARLGINAAAIKAEVAAEAKAKEKAKTPLKVKAVKAAPAPKVPAKSADADSVAPLLIGDRVRIREGLKGPSGHLRKCCGREGTISVIAGIHSNQYAVRFGPKSHEVVHDLKAGDLEKISPLPAKNAADAAAPAQGEQRAPKKPAPAPRAAQKTSTAAAPKGNDPAPATPATGKENTAPEVKAQPLSRASAWPFPTPSGASA